MKKQRTFYRAEAIAGKEQPQPSMTYVHTHEIVWLFIHTFPCVLIVNCWCFYLSPHIYYFVRQAAQMDHICRYAGTSRNTNIAFA